MNNLVSTFNRLLLFLIITFSLTACQKKEFEEIIYTANVPVIMGFEEFRAAVKKTAPKDLVNPGKIYIKDNFLFINEFQKGIHVIDNTNPSNPQKLAFIEIPGNVDMAVRNNTLFADSFIDLVAIDITDPSNPVETDRLKDAFPNVLPAISNIDYPVYGLDFAKGVVVGWETREVKEIVEVDKYYGWGKVQYDASTGVPSIGSNEVSINPSGAGIGGSMARFCIRNNYLFALHSNNLKVFNLQNVPGISLTNETYITREVETLFPYRDKLFMGTTTGMLVYDISKANNPVLISEFNHISSCDPVVINGDYAYVTLRSGTQCNGFANQLDIIDISDISSPYLVKSYEMINPHGLGIDGSTLFLCDGADGLKVYDVSDPLKVDKNKLAHYRGISTYDVIPLSGLLILIGKDGLFQYDYSNLDSLKLLSSIPVIRN